MDLKQADHKGVSGGQRLLELSDTIEGLNTIELTHNYRSAFVQEINKHWFENKQQ